MTKFTLTGRHLATMHSISLQFESDSGQSITAVVDGYKVTVMNWSNMTQDEVTLFRKQIVDQVPDLDDAQVGKFAIEI